jgi:hypothetical protein
MAKRRKRAMEATATVAGHEIHWVLRSEAQWTPDGGFKGVTFSVHLADMKHRELILEFPYPQAKVKGYQFPPRPKIFPEKVEAAIGQAIAAGWRPTSRGRPFIFEVPEEMT